MTYVETDVFKNISNNAIVKHFNRYNLVKNGCENVITFCFQLVIFILLALSYVFPIF